VRSRWPRIYHGVASLVWLALIPITVFTNLKTSLLWIAFLSVYANFVSEWGAYQAARTEYAVSVASDDLTT
jgi:hypothetical protein